MELPRFGLGTYQLHGQVCHDMVCCALQRGYSLIDTAQVYRNEHIVGTALKRSGVPRNKVFLVSKLHPKHLGSPETLEASVLESLEKLGIDYIDLFLIHWPGASKVPGDSPKNREFRKEAWSVLERLKDKGVLGEIGVSNFEVSHLEQLLETARIVPAVNQFEIHPLCFPRELIAYCKSKGIRIMAYSSLGQGSSLLFKNPDLLEISKSHSKTVAQVLLRWAIQHEFVVIPKASSEGRLAENADVMGFELSVDEMDRINVLGKDRPQRFCWDPTVIA